MVGIIKFVGWAEIKSAFLIFAGWQGIIILVLTALVLFAGMWKWKVILKSQGHSLSNRELAAPYLACFSITYLLPMVIFGGEIFRSYYLREKYSVPWGKAISSTIIDKILDVTSFLIAVFAGLIFFLLKIGLPPRNLGIILGGVLAFVTCGIGFFYFKIFRKESIARFFAKFFNHKRFLQQDILGIEREIFQFFKLKRRALWQGLSLAFFRVAITWLRCWVLILFLGKSIGVFPALSVLGFYYFALMIPIPTALGTHEVVQIFSFSALGLGANIAPAFTMIQRGSELILAFVGVIIFFRLGMGLVRTVLFKKIDSLLNNKT